MADHTSRVTSGSGGRGVGVGTRPDRGGRQGAAKRRHGDVWSWPGAGGVPVGEWVVNDEADEESDGEAETVEEEVDVDGCQTQSP